MSAPEQQHPDSANDASRERSLPSIRQILGAELNSSHSAEYSSHRRSGTEQQHGHYVSFPPEHSRYYYDHSGPTASGPSGSHPGPASAANYNLPGNTSGGLPSSHSNEGYSYGVLRTSGTSGTLTDAIPPSTHPQGIIRQTSYPTVHDERDDPNKRYMCEYCGKRFGMPSHLQIHIRTHTADKPFHCPWPGCNKSFTVKSNLTRHLKAHETK